MEGLKRKVKEIVPEDKLNEVDRIFCEWIASLKDHGGTTSRTTDGEDKNKKKQKEPPDDTSLKHQVDDLKKKIESFKEKMRMYKASTSSGMADLKEEILKVKQGISNLRLKFANQEGDEERRSENAELIEKLNEVKQFLEKLK